MDNTQRERIDQIILEMVNNDRHIIAAEIGIEIQKQLNIQLTNKDINVRRKRLGVNSFAIWEQDVETAILKAFSIR